MCILIMGGVVEGWRKDGRQIVTYVCVFAAVQGAVVFYGILVPVDFGAWMFFFQCAVNTVAAAASAAGGEKVFASTGRPQQPTASSFFEAALRANRVDA